MNLCFPSSLAHIDIVIVMIAWGKIIGKNINGFSAKAKKQENEKLLF